MTNIEHALRIVFIILSKSDLDKKKIVKCPIRLKFSWPNLSNSENGRYQCNKNAAHGVCRRRHCFFSALAPEVYELLARWSRSSWIEAKRSVPFGNSASIEPST